MIDKIKLIVAYHGFLVSHLHHINDALYFKRALRTLREVFKFQSIHRFIRVYSKLVIL